MLPYDLRITKEIYIDLWIKEEKNLQNVNKRLSLDSGIMGDFYSLYFFPIFIMHIHYFGSQEQYC